jgi:hypothetical protein
MRRRLVALGILAPSMLLVTSCGGGGTEVTHDFTSRMSQLDHLRTRVEQRVRTFKSYCSQPLHLTQVVCDIGVNYYTDSLQAPANSWIDEVESNVADTNSLKNISSYDGDLTNVMTAGASFNAWVDDLHSHRLALSSSGALSGPSVEDVAKVGIAVGESVWKNYKAGVKDHTDRIIARMDKEKFSSYEASAD